MTTTSTSLRVKLVTSVRFAAGIILIACFCTNQAVAAQEGTSSTEIQTDTSPKHNELPINRVLPVDADHKSKLISFPQQALDPICIQNLRENLVKFLKRVKSGKFRRGRQDDGDDGDDGEEGGIAGVLGGLAEGNGALSALSQLPAIVPQFVSALTQVSGAINQGLNGTDTPNLPSFIVKHGSQLIQAFTGQHQQSARPTAPPDPYVQRIPGEGPPVRKPRPPVPSYEYPPGPEDYPDELLQRPAHPTLRPLHPEEIGFRPRPPNYEAYPGSVNPGYFENVDARPPALVTESPQHPQESNQPPKTSLWQIYKSFQNRNPENGSLSDFQLAHPAAFSNELLQSISQSISNHRGQQSPGASASAVTEIPSSEIIKMFYPEKNQQQQQQSPPTLSAALINNLNRPTLSVYKPGSTISGVGHDLSELAMNATRNGSQQKPQKQQSGPASEEVNLPSPQQELETSSVLGRPTGNSDGKPVYNINKNSLVSIGSLSQLHPQQTQGTSETSGGPQFVKSPTSSILTQPIGEYIPAVSSLHEGVEDVQVVGPQAGEEDQKNGFGNKSPYTQVKGVLIDAPRLTPSPLLALKPPSNLYLGTQHQIYAPTTEAPFNPEFAFQAIDHKPGPSLGGTGTGPLLIPPGANAKPTNPSREPTVNAVISSNFNKQLIRNPLGASGVLPPSLLPENSNSIPQSETVKTTTEADVFPQEDISPVKSSPIASSLTNLAHSSVSYQPKPNLPNPNPFQQNFHNAPININRQPTETKSPFLSSLMNSNVNNNPLSQDTKLLQYLIVNYPQLLGLNINPNVAAQPSLPQQNNGEIADNFVAPSYGQTQPIYQIPEVTTPQPPPPTTQKNVEPEVVHSTQPSFSVDTNSNANSTIPPPPLPPVRKPALFLSQLNSQNNTRPKPSSSSGNRRPLPDVPISTSGNNAAVPNDIVAGGPILSSNWNVNGFAQTVTVPTTTVNPYDKQHYYQNVNFGGLLAQNSPSSQLNNGGIGSGDNNNNELTEPPTGEEAPGGILSSANFASPLQFPSAFPENNKVQLPVSTLSPVSSSPNPTEINNNGDGSSNNGEDVSSIGDLSQLYGNAPSQNRQPAVYHEDTSTTTPAPLRTSTSTSFSVSVVEELPDIGFSLGGGGFKLPDILNEPKPKPTDSNPPPLPPPLSGPTRSPPPLANVDISSFQGPLPIGGYPAYVPISTNVFFGTSSSSSSSLPNFGPSHHYHPPQQQQQQQQHPQQLHQNLVPSSIGNSAIAEMSKLPFFQEDTFRPSALPPYLIGGDKPQEEDSFEQGPNPSDSGKPISEIFSVVTSTIKDDPAEGSEGSVSSAEEQQQQIPNFPPGKPIYWMNRYYPNGLPVLVKVSTTTSVPTTKKLRRRKSTTPAGPTTTSAPEYYEDEDAGNKGNNGIKKRRKNVNAVNEDFVTD